jgi:hypothetical protein
MIKTATQQKDLFNRKIDISRQQSSSLELDKTHPITALIKISLVQ